MALIKTPDGGFYVNDDEFEVDYSTNSISLTGQGGGGVAGVSSFNGRTGAVVPQDGDYTAEQVGAVSLSGGTMTGNLILNGDPTNNLQAATKQYVDILGDTVNDILDGTEALPYLHDDYTPPIATSSSVGTVKPGTGLEVSGDGTLSVTTSPTSGITQEQADLRYLQLTGGTLTGNLVLGDNKITTNSTPSAVSDVTNKGYVDGVVKVVSDEVDGIIAGTTPISVPIATDTKVGGVKIGAGLSIDGEGTLSTSQTFESNMDMNTHSIINCGRLKFTGDPFIESDSTLIIGVPGSGSTSSNRSTAMFSTNINGIGLVQSDDYIYGMIVQNLEADSYQPTVGIGAIDTNGLNLESNYLANAKGILIDYSGNIKFTSTNSIDFGNVNLTNVANPVNDTDVVNKQYADATYATISSVPTVASTSQAGIVKQISNIAQLDASSATTEQIATTVNSLLTALQDAGIMSAT